MNKEIIKTKKFIPIAYLIDFSGTKYFLRSASDPALWIYTKDDYTNFINVENNLVLSAISKHGYNFVGVVEEFSIEELPTKLAALSKKLPEK